MVLSGILIVSGCGGSSSSDGDAPSAGDTGGELKISGELLDTGLVRTNWFDGICNRLVHSAYAVGGKPDKIVSVSKDGSVLDTYDVADDGAFEIGLSEIEDETFSLFVVNTVSGHIVGHINLGNGDNDETLDIFDGSTIKRDLALGALNINNLTGPNIEGLNAFGSSDKAFLKAVSVNDDATVSHRNKLTNTGVSSYLAIAFHLASVADITDQYFDISGFSKETNFKGMMPLFYYHGEGANALENISLYPPEGILHSDPNNTKDDFKCELPSDRNTGIEKKVVYSASRDMVTIETAYVDSLPKGEWTLKNADTDGLLGAFVFSDMKPFNNSGVFKSFVPIPKINTNADGVVTSLNLQFRRYDNSGAKLINKHFFDTLCENLLISYVVAGSSETQNMTLLEVNDGDDELTFNTSDAVDISKLERVIISYEIGEAKYQFVAEKELN